MKIIKSQKIKELENKPHNWKEMVQHYQKRTNKHINLVRKYLDILSEKFPELNKNDIESRKKKHDKSKFEQPENTPYVYITWKYRMKDEGKEFNVPQEVQDKMNEATVHHIISNSHHPEYWCGRKTGLINQKNRDKPPEEIVDATKMPNEDIQQMCCDWSAVSEERGNSPLDWAKNNINIRWKFTKQQEDLIYKTLNKIWSK